MLPGFRLALGYTLLYLSLMVLIPIGALALKASTLTLEAFWAAVTSPRALATYRVSFGLSLAAAAVNAVMGLIVAWALVRYPFPGRALVDAMVDLPFALPTAVAGITLTALYAPSGLLGRAAGAFGVKVAYTPLGIGVALTFIGLPFVVRTLQPVLLDMDPTLEEASATLGAGRLQTVTRVILPELWSPLVTGFALAFARAIGEYGSVIFIAGNMPMKTEIAPLLIMTKLDQFQEAEAAALGVVMLVVSFVALLFINALQARATRRRSA